MSHVEIDRSKEPIRLFKSDFLEFFTHIHPVVVLIIWMPVVAIFLGIAIIGRPEGVSPIYIPVCFAAGLFVWTFAEYMLHRFVFPFRPRTPWQERVSVSWRSSCPADVQGAAGDAACGQHSSCISVLWIFLPGFECAAGSASLGGSFVLRFYRRVSDL